MTLRLVRSISFVAAAASLFLVLSAGFAPAAVVLNTQIPIVAAVLANPCPPGNPLSVTTTLHVLVRVTTTPSGNLKFGAHINTDGVTATDIVTSAAYTGHLAANVGFNTGAGSATEFTTTLNFGLETAGAGNNLLGHITVHFTVDPAGNVTASVVNVSVTCV